MEKYENIQKEAPDRAYEMDSYLIDTVLTYIDDQDKQSLITLLNEYHPADIADLFEQINPNKTRTKIHYPSVTLTRPFGNIGWDS